jgi:hypothetical protein
VVDRSRPEISGTGRIDHFGFEASDYAGMKAKLDAYGAELMEQILPAIGLHQIFAQSPDGVWIELNFDLDDYRSGFSD